MCQAEARKCVLYFTGIHETQLNTVSLRSIKFQMKLESVLDRVGFCQFQIEFNLNACSDA